MTSIKTPAHAQAWQGFAERVIAALTVVKRARAALPIVAFFDVEMPMNSSTSLIACTLILLASTAQAASDPATVGARPSPSQPGSQIEAGAEKPADTSRLRQADAAAQKMAEHARALASQSKAAMGDWSQRTSRMIVRLAHAADQAARDAAMRWKVEVDAAGGAMREDFLRVQQAVDSAALATTEALSRARETAEADIQKSKEEAAKATAAAREAFEKAEIATRDAARAAREAVSKASKRPARNP